MNFSNWKSIVNNSRNFFFKSKSDIYNSLLFSKNYTNFYNLLIISLVQSISMKKYGTLLPKDIAVYSFGASSRNEMLGGSDADIIIYRRTNSKQCLDFKLELEKELYKYGFYKVDIPSWGSIKEVERYIKTSVTESNKIIDSRFIVGDLNISEIIEDIKVKHYNPDILARNLLFQYFYFNQYYERKKTINDINLKFCHGGIRDILFPSWYSYIESGCRKNNFKSEIENALDMMIKLNLIDNNARNIYLQDISSLLYIKDELIRNIEKDNDGVLNSESVKILVKNNSNFDSYKEVYKIVEKSRESIYFLKQKSIEGLFNYFEKTKTIEWNIKMRSILDTCMDDNHLYFFENDEFLDIAYIWTNEKIYRNNFDYIQSKLNSTSWVVLASLASNPSIPGDVLDQIINKITILGGYEHIFEIVARNPNIKSQTLKNILKSNYIEDRFKEPLRRLMKND